MKPLKHFIAGHPRTLKVLDLYFYSLKQAFKFNPGLTNWKEVING